MSNFDFTPARTIAPTYTHKTTGHTLEVSQDDCADSPLNWGFEETLWPFNGPRNSNTYEPTCEASQRFERLLDTLEPEFALRVLNRHSKAFLGGTQYQITTLRGYSQGDWLDVLEESGGSPNTSSFNSWLWGDVFYVSCSDCGDSMGGIFADSEEEAADYFSADICQNNIEIESTK